MRNERRCVIAGTFDVGHILSSTILNIGEPESPSLVIQIGDYRQELHIWIRMRAQPADRVMSSRSGNR